MVDAVSFFGKLRNISDRPTRLSLEKLTSFLGDFATDSSVAETPLKQLATK